MYKLVLLRHGQSVWNKSNKFTGWTDVGLSKQGINEAKEAGKILKKQGFVFDLAYTSVLKRATKTLDYALKEMNLKISVIYSWKLNERHYGALQGLNKTETCKKEGEKQVHIWRRSYNVRPPLLTKKDIRWPGHDPLYKNILRKDLPYGECLKDTINRVLPYYKEEILKNIKKGRKIIISAHGNSLRALVKYLDKISNKEIPNLNIPTGIPLVYELNSKFKPIKHYYLGDKEKISQAINKVKNQAKSS